MRPISPRFALCRAGIVAWIADRGKHERGVHDAVAAHSFARDDQSIRASMRRTLVISLPASRIRATASASGSIATAI